MSEERSSDDVAKATFEDSLEALQGILSELEDGDLPLMESIEKYRQGIEAFKTCGLLLDEARKTVELLTEEAMRALDARADDEEELDG